MEVVSLYGRFSPNLLIVMSALTQEMTDVVSQWSIVEGMIVVLSAEGMIVVSPGSFVEGMMDLVSPGSIVEGMIVMSAVTQEMTDVVSPGSIVEGMIVVLNVEGSIVEGRNMNTGSIVEGRNMNTGSIVEGRNMNTGSIISNVPILRTL
jgi:hypothetical protein